MIAHSHPEGIILGTPCMNLSIEPFRKLERASRIERLRTNVPSPCMLFLELDDIEIDAFTNFTDVDMAQLWRPVRSSDRVRFKYNGFVPPGFLVGCHITAILTYVASDERDTVKLK